MVGFSSHVYEVTESTGSVNVHVVKNCSSDIAISVLLNTTAGTALGNHIHCTVKTMNRVHCVQYLHLSQLVVTTEL